MKAAFTIAVFLMATTAHADIVLYNGDFSGGDASVTQADTLSDMFVFDNINIGDSHVTTIWGNFLIYQQYASSSLGLNYEIRTGVSSGNGGTLVAQGSVANLQQTATGRSTQNGAYREVQLLGTVNLNLTPGVYWLGLQNNEGTKPPAQWTSFLAQTSGGNAGPGGDPNPTPQNGILDHSSFATGTELGGFIQQGADYSIGVITTSSAVPEPASGALLAFAATALSVTLRFRRRGNLQSPGPLAP